MADRTRRGTSTPGTPEVDELIDRIRRGDPRAFSRLVAEIEPFVSGSSLKVCRDRDVASGKAHDTFITVYRKLHQFDGTSKFTTWLYSIIVNNCRMKRRRRLREKATVSTDEIDEAQIDTALKSNSAPYGTDRRLLLDELHRVL